MPQDRESRKTATFTREQNASYALQGLQVSNICASRKVSRLPVQLLLYIADKVPGLSQD